MFSLTILLILFLGDFVLDVKQDKKMRDCKQHVKNGCKKYLN